MTAMMRQSLLGGGNSTCKRLWGQQVSMFKELKESKSRLREGQWGGRTEHKGHGNSLNFLLRAMRMEVIFASLCSHGKLTQSDWLLQHQSKFCKIINLKEIFGLMENQGMKSYLGRNQAALRVQWITLSPSTASASKLLHSPVPLTHSRKTSVFPLSW